MFLQGETKVQVARDLDCPVSTVAGWWSRRDQIAQALNQSLSTSTTTESVETSKENGSVESTSNVSLI